MDELHKRIVDEEELIGNTLMKGLLFVQEMHDPGVVRYAICSLFSVYPFTIAFKNCSQDIL